MYQKIIIFLFVVFFIPSVSFGATYGSNYLTNSANCSADTFQVNYECSKALDANLGTRYASDNSSFPHYWIYDVSSTPKTIDKISISHISASGEQWKGYEIYGGHTTSSWDLLGSGDFAEIGSDGDYLDVELTYTGDQYEYLKLVGTSNYNGGNNYYTFYEAEAYECIDCSLGSSTSTTSTYSEICTVNGSTTTCTSPLKTQVGFVISTFVFFLSAFVTYKYLT